MTFTDFSHKYETKNEATSSKNIYQIFSILSLNDVKSFLGDGTFSSNVGIVKLHPTKGTHWVAYTNQNFFDSFGCSRPQKLSKFIKKQNGSFL